MESIPEPENCLECCQPTEVTILVADLLFCVVHEYHVNINTKSFKLHWNSNQK